MHEHTLDRDFVRPVFGQQRSHGIENTSQTQQEIAAADTDAAVGDVPLARGATINHTVTSTDRARIEAEDAALHRDGSPRRRHGSATASAGALRPKAAPGAAGISRHATTCRVRPLLE